MDHPTSTLDQLIQNDRIQMIKAALPYFHLSEQRFLSLYIKLQELQNTMSLYQQDEDTLSACSLRKEDVSIFEMLQDIQKYCPKREQESIEQILNFINVYQMYQTYQSASAQFNNGNSEETMEQLKGMLSPEQRSIFETYLANSGN